MELTLFDIISIAIIFISSFFGFFKGMVSVLLGLCSFFLSIWLTSYINPYVIDVLQEYIKDEMMTKLFGSFFSFIFSYLVLTITISPIANLFGSFNYSIFDRILGIAAGFFRGLIITGILLFAFIAPIIARTEQNNLEEFLPNWLKNAQIFQMAKPFISLKQIQKISKLYFKATQDIKDAEITSIENIFKQISKEKDTTK